MKPQFSLFVLSGLFFLLIFSQCKNEDEAKYRFDLKFFTEEYKPINYVENDILKGLAPDLLIDVCENLNITFEPEVLPWDEAYELAQNTKNAVLFSTNLTAERKDLFKWAGPIATLDVLFYSLPQTDIELENLDDAKSVSKIGVLEDYSIEQYLVGEGFKNLVICEDNDDAFEKLLKGEIDLYPSDKITAEASLKKLGKTIYHVSEKLVIKTDLTYIAFNKNVPDDVVADFQNQIDILKTNGSMKALYQTYFNSSDFPGTIQFYTEQYPPITFRDKSGSITGFGTDIVREIMKRNQTFGEIRLSSWSNGYNLALYHPNICLFTMDQTVSREPLFKWVGPIGSNVTYIYTKSGSGITLNSLNEAKSLNSIGTVSSWFSDQYLRNQGFTNLVSDSDPAVMTQMLINGEIDAFVCTSVTFPSILRELGYGYESVVPSVPIISSDFYIAFSKSTPTSLVERWQSSFLAMKSDGTYNAIFDRWLKQ